MGGEERRSRSSSVEEAASALQRALLTCVGPGAAEQIALAQVRLAWQEVTAEAGLSRGPLHSRVTRFSNGVAHVEASDAMLAGELRLRAEALAWAVNLRMQDRPGASLRITSLTIVVGRADRGGSL